MDRIEDVDLKALVSVVSNELITEKRNVAANSIKQHLQRVEQLAYDVSSLEKQLKQKKEKLAKAQAKVDKIREGDWSLLADKKDSPKGHNNGSRNEVE